jgi:arylsulfatase A-like enzyme
LSVQIDFRPLSNGGLASRWRAGKGVRTAPRDALVADSVDAPSRGLAFGVHRAADTGGAVLSLLVALLAVAALGIAPVSCRTSAGPKPNILLIVIDTLRADHLGAYGYPGGTSPIIDRFAAENIKFNYAISTAPWTSPSVASLFTGTYPTAHGVTQHISRSRMPTDAVSKDFATLAEVLSDAGYRTAGVTANAWVADNRGFAQGFDTFKTINYADAKRVNGIAHELLESLRESTGPFFLYVHYMDPHTPFTPPPKLAKLFLRKHREGLSGGGPVRTKLAKYDAEIRFLDMAIGKLFGYLKSVGLYEDLVIALVADHGRQFMEHGIDGHGHKLHNEETHVPLIIKSGGRREEIDTTVSIIDIYPTLLRIAGLDWPSLVQGVSLLDDLEQRKQRGVFSEVTVGRNHKAFVTHDARKLVLAFDGLSHEIVSPKDEKGVVGLFESRGDYFEQRPVNDEPMLQELRRRLFETYRESVEINGFVEPETAELRAETIEELKALGYFQ